MTPDQYCQQRASASGSSFYYSFLFLPLERRRAITALYAFCREVDDTVDEATESAVAAARLDWWQQELQRLFQGKPEHPVTKALLPHVVPFNLTSHRLNQVIDGMRMDLSQTRYLDFAGLKIYCHRVAGVVGEMAAGIFGQSDEATMAYAGHLGLCLQLINIIRDVGEDARRGRIYLPVDDLQKHGVKASDILNSRYVEGFVPLMQAQATRARQAYLLALKALPPSQIRAQRAGLIMAGIYLALLDELERDQFQVLHQRVSLTPLRKLLIAWRIWVFGPRRPVPA